MSRPCACAPRLSREGRLRRCTPHGLAFREPHPKASQPRSLRVHADSAETQTQESPARVTLPTRMNNVPHAREMRRYFYNDAAEAVMTTMRQGNTRLKVRCTVPELNPEMDVYRVGTLLELVREIAAQVAEDGRRVKVCVQGSMGQGVFQGLPLSLSGVSRIMQVMDWGESADFVSFGAVGKKDIDDSTDVYIIVAPQNIVGNTIMTDLTEMVDAAELHSKPVVLVNPILKDMPGAAGVMGVRGRDVRLAFEDSFVVAYHFRLLYFAGFIYPIMGALRYSFGDKWQVFKRVDLSRREEEFKLWGEFNREPSGGEITQVLQEKMPLALRGKVPEESISKGGKWW